MQKLSELNIFVKKNDDIFNFIDHVKRVVNRPSSSVNEGSLKITRTVPLIKLLVVSSPVQGGTTVWPFLGVSVILQKVILDFTQFR